MLPSGGYGELITSSGGFVSCFVHSDFAVGAPFQDSGKVFIWMGSKNGISKEPSQVKQSIMGF